MDKLLASAETRKRDYLLAQEKKYKKEREEEGDEFKGKEKFVTNAYKRQQEEIRKAEEEERLKEGTHPQSPTLFPFLYFLFVVSGGETDGCWLIC